MDYYLSKSSSRKLFGLIVEYMKHSQKIKFKNELRGLDQFYFDFFYKGEEYTLHLEHYLGIMIISNSKNLEIKTLVNEIITDVIITFIK